MPSKRQTDLTLGNLLPLGDDSPVREARGVLGFISVTGHVPVTHHLGSLPTSWRLRVFQRWAATFEMSFAGGRQVLWSPPFSLSSGVRGQSH